MKFNSPKSKRLDHALWERFALRFRQIFLSFLLTGDTRPSSECTGVEIWLPRFSVSFVLKFAPQKGEGEKRRGVQIFKWSTQNLWHHKYLNPCTFVCTLRTGRSTFTAAGVQFDHHNILTFVYSLHPILMYLIGKGYDRPEWYNGTPAILGGRGERKVSFGGDPWLNRQFYRDLESNSFIHMMWKVELKIPAKLGKFGFQTSASLRHLVMLSRNLEGICLLNPEAALPLSYIAPISILNQVLLEINANRLNDEVCSEIGRGSDGEFAHCQIMQSFTVIGPRLRESHIGP